MEDLHIFKLPYYVENQMNERKIGQKNMEESRLPKPSLLHSIESNGISKEDMDRRPVLPATVHDKTLKAVVKAKIPEIYRHFNHKSIVIDQKALKRKINVSNKTPNVLLSSPIVPLLPTRPISVNNNTRAGISQYKMSDIVLNNTSKNLEKDKNVSGIKTECKERLIARACYQNCYQGVSEILKSHDTLLSSLLQEIDNEFKSCMQNFSFDDYKTTIGLKRKTVELIIDEKGYSFPRCKSLKISTSQKNEREVSLVNFEVLKQTLSDAQVNLMSIPEIYPLFSKMQQLCDKLLSATTLFNMLRYGGKSIRRVRKQYLQYQRDHLYGVKMYLRDDWRLSIILMTQHIMKDYCNFHTMYIGAYTKSLLQRLLIRIEEVLASTLDNMLVKSFKDSMDFFNKYKLQRVRFGRSVHINDGSWVTKLVLPMIPSENSSNSLRLLTSLYNEENRSSSNTFQIQQDVEKKKFFMKKKPRFLAFNKKHLKGGEKILDIILPLFSVTLSISDRKKEISLVPDKGDVLNAIQNCLQEAMDMCNEINDLQSEIMENLNLPRSSLLEKHQPKGHEERKIIADALMNYISSIATDCFSHCNPLISRFHEFQKMLLLNSEDIEDRRIDEKSNSKSQKLKDINDKEYNDKQEDDENELSDSDDEGYSDDGKVFQYENINLSMPSSGVSNIYRILSENKRDRIVRTKKTKNIDVGMFAEMPDLIKESVYSEVIQFAKAIRMELQQLHEDVTDFQSFGLIEVNCVAIKETMGKSADEMVETISKEIVSNCSLIDTKILNIYEDMMNQMAILPRTESMLESQSHFLSSLQDKIKTQKYYTDIISRRLLDLESMGQNKVISVSYLHEHWKLYSWPKKISRASMDCRERFESAKKSMAEILRNEKRKFEEEIADISREILTFSKKHSLATSKSIEDVKENNEIELCYVDYKIMDVIIEEASNIKERIISAKQNSEQLNYREKVFNWPQSKYRSIEKLDREFEPYLTLWTLAADFSNSIHLWENSYIRDLNADEIIAKTNRWDEKAHKLMSDLQNNTFIIKTIENICTKLKNFKKILPVISMLASPAIKDYHWRASICKLINGLNENDNADTVTLSYLLKTKALDQAAKLNSVYLVALEEYKLEIQLKEMIREGMQISFSLLKQKNIAGNNRAQDFSRVVNLNDIKSFVEDQLTSLHIILRSNYIKYLKKNLYDWKDKLELLLDIVFAWERYQNLLIILSPILEMHHDVISPTIVREYQFLLESWRSSMQVVAANPSLSKMAENSYFKLTFESSSEKLENIKEQLVNFWELLRIEFPNFFFLSDEELLDLYSSNLKSFSQMPLAILKKIFPAVADVLYDKEDNSLIGIFTNDREILYFRKCQLYDDKIDEKLNTKTLALFFSKLGRTIHETIKRSIHDLIVAEYDRNNKENMLTATGQIDDMLRRELYQVVAVYNEVIWSKDMELLLNKAAEEYKGNLSKNKKNFINNYFTEKINEIEYLIKILGDNTGNNQDTNRDDSFINYKISALILQKKYFYEFSDTIININEVCDVNDFTWKKEIRRYHIPATKEHNICLMDNSLTYNNELISLKQSGGLFVRSINVTEFYFSVIDALCCCQPANIIGKPASGKKFLVRQLSATLGTSAEIVLANSYDSQSNSYKKFFNYLSGCLILGKWFSFFFNENITEKFNLVSVYFSSIEQILCSKKIQKKISFPITPKNDGSNKNSTRKNSVLVTIHPLSNFLLISNSSEYVMKPIQDRLATIFRPCCVIQPDKRRWTSLLLFAFGFWSYLKIGKTLSVVMEIASGMIEQNLGLMLNSYKFILQVIYQASFLLYRKCDDIENIRSKLEVQVVMRSINKYVLSQLNNQDSQIFERVLVSLFSEDTYTLNEEMDERMESRIEDSCSELSFQPSDYFIKKCSDLYNAIRYYPYVIILGEAASGKTSILETVKHFWEKDSESTVEMERIFPESLSSVHITLDIMKNFMKTEALLDKEYDNDNDDEKLACQRNYANGQKWIILDGFEPATVAAAAHLIGEKNNQIFSENQSFYRLIVECAESLCLCPSMLSSVATIFVENANFHWSQKVDLWLRELLQKNTIDESLAEFLAYIIEDLFNNLFKIINYINPVILIGRVMYIFTEIFTSNPSSIFEEVNKGDEKKLAFVDGVFIFSFLISISSSEELISNQLKEESSLHTLKEFIVTRPSFLRNDNITLESPSEMFLYFFNTNSLKWQKWNEYNEEILKYDFSSKFFVLGNATGLLPNRNLVLCWYLINLTSYTGRRPLLISGPVGSGKTTAITFYKKKLKVENNNSPWIYYCCNFTTHSKRISELVVDQMSHINNNEINVPGNDLLTVFLDDMHLASTGLDIVRQYYTTGSWYCWKYKKNVNVGAIQFLAALTTEKHRYSDTLPSKRILRHFLFFHFDDHLVRSICSVYSFIYENESYLIYRKENNYETKVDSMKQMNLFIQPIQNGFLQLHKEINQDIKASIFTWRNLIRAYRAITFDWVKLKSVSKDKQGRLFAHEILREYDDVIEDVNEKDKFRKILLRILRDYFSNSVSEYIKEAFRHHGIIFCLPLQLISDDRSLSYDVGSTCLSYEEVIRFTTFHESIRRLHNMKKTYLDDVITPQTVKYIPRILRILSKEYNNHILSINEKAYPSPHIYQFCADILDLKLYTLAVEKFKDKNELELTEFWDSFIINIVKKEKLILKDLKNSSENNVVKKINILIVAYRSEEIPLSIWDLLSTSFQFKLFPTRSLQNSNDTCSVHNIEKVEFQFRMIFEFSNSYITKDIIKNFRPLNIFARIFRFEKFENETGQQIIRSRLNLDESFFTDELRQCMISSLHDFRSLLRSEWHAYLKDVYKTESIYGISDGNVDKTKMKEIDGKIQQILDSMEKTNMNTVNLILKDCYKKWTDRYEKLKLGIQRIKLMEKFIEKKNEELQYYQSKRQAYDQILHQIKDDQYKHSIEQLTPAIKQTETAEKKLLEREGILKLAQESIDLQLSKYISDFQEAKEKVQGIERSDIPKVQNSVFSRIEMCAILLFKHFMPSSMNAGKSQGEGNGNSGRRNSIGRRSSSSRNIMDVVDMGSNLFYLALGTLEIDQISSSIIIQVEKIFKISEFDANIVSKTSKTGEKLGRWLISLIEYYHAKEKVKNEIDEAKKLTVKVTAIKNEVADLKTNEIIKLNQSLMLTADSESLSFNSSNLQKKIETVQKKRDVAQYFISKFGKELAKWENEIDKLLLRKNNLIGDSLLSAAVITYFGPFHRNKRRAILENLVKCLQSFKLYKFIDDNEVSYNTVAKITSIYSEFEIESSAWIAQNLPREHYFIENAIILQMTNTLKKRCFLLDPQCVASNWLKSLFLSREMTRLGKTLYVTSQTDSAFSSTIEKSINAGQQVMVKCYNPEIFNLAHMNFLRELANVEAKSIRLEEKDIQIPSSWSIIYILNDDTPFHYSRHPELFDHLNVINFSILPDDIIKTGIYSEIVRKHLFTKIQRELSISQKNQINDIIADQKQYYYCQEQLLNHLSNKKVDMNDEEITQKILNDSSLVEMIDQTNKTVTRVIVREELIKKIHILQSYWVNPANGIAVPSLPCEDQVIQRICSLYYCTVKFKKLNNLYIIYYKEFLKWIDISIQKCLKMVVNINGSGQNNNPPSLSKGNSLVNVTPILYDQLLVTITSDIFMNVLYSLFPWDHSVWAITVSIRIILDALPDFILTKTSTQRVVEFLSGIWHFSSCIEFDQKWEVSHKVNDRIDQDDLRKPNWMPLQVWSRIFKVSNLPEFSYFQDYVIKYGTQVKEIYDNQRNLGHTFMELCRDSCISRAPTAATFIISFKSIYSGYEALHKLVFLSCIRPDSMTCSTEEDFITNILGKDIYYQLNQPLLTMSEITSRTPISKTTTMLMTTSHHVNIVPHITDISKRNDINKPTHIIDFYESKNYNHFKTIISSAVDQGEWIIFTNCDRYNRQTLIEIEKLCLDIDHSQNYSDFRIWIIFSFNYDTRESCIPTALLRKSNKFFWRHELDLKHLVIDNADKGRIASMYEDMKNIKGNGFTNLLQDILQLYYFHYSFLNSFFCKCCWSNSVYQREDAFMDKGLYFITEKLIDFYEKDKKYEKLSMPMKFTLLFQLYGGMMYDSTTKQHFLTYYHSKTESIKLFLNTNGLNMQDILNKDFNDIWNIFLTILETISSKNRSIFSNKYIGKKLLSRNKECCLLENSVDQHIFHDFYKTVNQINTHSANKEAFNNIKNELLSYMIHTDNDAISQCSYDFILSIEINIMNKVLKDIEMSDIFNVDHNNTTVLYNDKLNGNKIWKKYIVFNIYPETISSYLKYYKLKNAFYLYWLQNGYKIRYFWLNFFAFPSRILMVEKFLLIKEKLIRLTELNDLNKKKDMIEYDLDIKFIIPKNFKSSNDDMKEDNIYFKGIIVYHGEWDTTLHQLTVTKDYNVDNILENDNINLRHYYGSDIPAIEMILIAKDEKKNDKNKLNFESLDMLYDKELINNDKVNRKDKNDLNTFVDTQNIVNNRTNNINMDTTIIKNQIIHSFPVYYIVSSDDSNLIKTPFRQRYETLFYLDVPLPTNIEERNWLINHAYFCIGMVPNNNIKFS